ncbi:hypothetical protein CIB48_g4073 [Xylaria polymorpha]|nr:hypothetical protein CIB48_g4073 [Xylaria polymorpha]
MLRGSTSWPERLPAQRADPGANQDGRYRPTVQRSTPAAGKQGSVKVAYLVESIRSSDRLDNTTGVFHATAQEINPSYDVEAVVDLDARNQESPGAELFNTAASDVVIYGVQINLSYLLTHNLHYFQMSILRRIGADPGPAYNGVARSIMVRPEYRGFRWVTDIQSEMDEIHDKRNRL